MSSPPENITVTVEGETLPVVELLTGRGFITGKSGSGKSMTASVIAERLLEHDLSFLIVDTDGEYFGLKEKYEVLHVGADDTCDAVVGPEHADLLAELALEDDVPIVLDVSGYLDTDEVEDLLERVARALFVREKTVKKPFLLLVEEAHEYLPETGGLTELGERLLQIAKRGRKRGLGICAISQRPAAVDKDYITQCNWMVWHRLTWNNDTDVVKRIIDPDAAKTVEELDNGEALLMTDWDEQIRRVKFQMRETVDVGQTPDFSTASVPDLRSIDHSLVRRLEEQTTGSRNARSPPADSDSEQATPDESKPSDDSAAASPSVSSAGQPTTETAQSNTSQHTADQRDNVLLELGDMMVFLFTALGRRTTRFVHSLRDRFSDSGRQ